MFLAQVHLLRRVAVLLVVLMDIIVSLVGMFSVNTRSVALKSSHAPGTSFVFRVSWLTLLRRSLGASLPQRIPEKQRRVPVVAVGSIVPRRLGGRYRPIGISCPCAQGSPVAPVAKINRERSALIAPR